MVFSDLLGIGVVSADTDRVEATMPITPDLYQPFGFLHGGVTLSFLETIASIGAENRTDLNSERPFGIEVHVRHRKSGQAGMLRGVAELDRIEGSKQFWNVAAYDDEGDVVSDGVIVTKVVSLERLEEKQRERAASKRTGVH